MGNWIVPFKGRNASGAFQQNLLWNDRNVYIMDNHRAALWCWMQHLKKTEIYNLIHIDCHYDTLYSNIDEWLHHVPALNEISISDYLDHTFRDDSASGVKSLLFMYDNYLSIFLEKYKDMLSDCIFATHEQGDVPKKGRLIKPWDLSGNLKFWLSESENKWICNLDLDYFFYPDNFESYNFFFSDSYVKQICASIKVMLEKEKIQVLTISLSPECCGGWPNSEAMLDTVCQELGIDFQLS
jgi:hypothetical protein